jgi:DivIVA domain-containing protein
MIELTPLDVRKKKDDLRRAVRGYDVAQVDAFLDITADRLEEVVQQNRGLSDRLSALGEQLEAYKEREHALNEALLTAQELREEARSQARRESALKLQEAEVQAKQLVEAAERTVQSSAGRMEELRGRRRHFLDSFRDTLRRYMEELDIEERRLSAELAARNAVAEPAREKK